VSSSRILLDPNVTSGFMIPSLLTKRHVMEPKTERFYQAQEFARRAGVTVRALHHYDRLGVLKPSRRTRAGYRLYADRDFVRLQQIVTLKFIGFSLAEIKRLLGRGALDILPALRRQRELITRKRDHMGLAVRAIERAERLLEGDREPGSDVFVKIIEVINMQNDMTWTGKYYSDEARRELEQRAGLVSAEAVHQAERDWAALIREVERAAVEGEGPASEKSRDMAARWKALLNGFTGGSSAIQDGLNKMYSDQANWPESFPKPFSDLACAFIRQAMSARRK
jgi:DNA-binding transcriptional MerR regulator